ncbi:MAG: hypothetical protein JNJ83_15170 [Verrucomicrobiaceae bacterium]|nr:hypothetical protein [Verrucomicrobiaceae bacterium]
MATADQAAEVTLEEPREVAEFITALGITAHELELIAIVTGWQKRAPRKITPAALRKYCCYDQRKRLNYHQNIVP